MNKELKAVVREMEKICANHIDKPKDKSKRYGCDDCPLDIKPYCLKSVIEYDDIKKLKRM